MMIGGGGGGGSGDDDGDGDYKSLTVEQHSMNIFTFRHVT